MDYVEIYAKLFDRTLEEGEFVALMKEWEGAVKQSGYDAGYDAGYMDGRAGGYDDGYDDGLRRRVR